MSPAGNNLHPKSVRFLKGLIILYGLITVGSGVSALFWWSYSALSLFILVLSLVGLIWAIQRREMGFSPHEGATSEDGERTLLWLFTVGKELRPVGLLWPLGAILFLLVCGAPYVAFLTQLRY